MNGHQASNVQESVVVGCPYPSAQQFLQNDMLDELGKFGTLTLRVPIRGTNVTKNVVVVITPGIDPMHMDQPWHVRWTPEGGGPYPDFDGEMTVRADEDWNSSLLELRGTYVPPGGALGKAFDTAIGQRIAAATAQALLRSVAGTLEVRYREQEARKHAAQDRE